MKHLITLGVIILKCTKWDISMFKRSVDIWGSFVILLTQKWLISYSFGLPMRDRIDTALTWMTEENFDIVVIYFNLPDFNLHSYGTEDQRTIDTLHDVDEALGYLFDRIDEEDLTDVVNVIIASDHGHINSEVGKHVLLYDYINPADVNFTLPDYGPCFQLNPVDGKLEEVLTYINA